jgi:hypothetical protein
VITGALKIATEFDPDLLYQSLKDKIFQVVIEDATSIDFAGEALAKEASGLVVGRYLEFLKAEQEANPEDAKIIERARQLGLRLLKGGAG